jgi:hypothetical protein
LVVATSVVVSQALAPVSPQRKPLLPLLHSESSSSASLSLVSRRSAFQSLGWVIGTTTAGMVVLGSNPLMVVAAAEEMSSEGSMNVENYLRTGMVSMPMGVSGQAGKRYEHVGRSCSDDFTWGTTRCFFHFAGMCVCCYLEKRRHWCKLSCTGWMVRCVPPSPDSLPLIPPFFDNTFKTILKIYWNQSKTASQKRV